MQLVNYRHCIHLFFDNPRLMLFYCEQITNLYIEDHQFNVRER